MNYYITGISGTGKSTIGEALRKRGLLVYDLDAIPGLCYWKNKETGIEAKYNTGVGKEWLEAHEWLCDTNKLKEILKGNLGTDVIVVGIASNQKEFLNYFSKIFLLYCSEETFINRLKTRDEGNGFAKDESEQEHVLSWYKEFEDGLRMLGAIPIDTEQSVDKVVSEIALHISA